MIDDDTAGPDAGAVYLFDGDPSSPTFGDVLQTFLNPTPAPGDFFGGYGVVGVAGNVAVSAAFDDTVGPNAGAVYLFDATTGALLHTFLPPAPAGLASFGYDITAAGSTLVVGAPDKLPERGVVYLYDADVASPTFGTLLRTIVNPSSSYGGEEFGSKLAATADRLLIGTPFLAPSFGGAAYLYDVATGALLRTFTSPNPEYNGQFGFGVALVGAHALIGTNHESAAGLDAGSAYVFDADPMSPAFGELLQTLYPESSMVAPAAGSRFGSSVAGAGTNLVVGAAFADAGAPAAGLVHVFTPCGDGIISAVEDCEDGNTVGGDCCSELCRLEPSGSACDEGDGDACTTGTCSVATCVPQGAVPQPGCHAPTEPATGHFRVQSAVGRPPSVQWKWRSGESIPAEAYADPLTTTDYTLCVYDESAAPQPVLRASAPAGGLCAGKPCWRRQGGRLKYKDADRTPDGLHSLTLQPGEAGKAQILLKGGGANLPVAPLPFTTTVTVQLKASTGACWEAEYDAPTRNTAEHFKASND